MKIPKAISPCPIVEAIVELRIKPSPEVPIDAIFGLAYEKLRSSFPKVTNLPSLNIPEQVREADPNLKYQAQHRLSNDTYNLSVGPRVLVFSCHSPYPGWTSFNRVIQESLEKLVGIDGYITGIERVGVRFINFFETKLEDALDFGVSAPRLNLSSSRYHTTLILPEEQFTNTVQLANPANILRGGESKTGSVVDIDTYCIDEEGGLLKDINGVIENAHICEKKVFFSLLKKEVVATLNPKY